MLHAPWRYRCRLNTGLLAVFTRNRCRLNTGLLAVFTRNKGDVHTCEVQCFMSRLSYSCFTWTSLAARTSTESDHHDLQASSGAHRIAYCQMNPSACYNLPCDHIRRNVMSWNNARLKCSLDTISCNQSARSLLRNRISWNYLSQIWWKWLQNTLHR